MTIEYFFKPLNIFGINEFWLLYKFFKAVIFFSLLFTPLPASLTVIEINLHPPWLRLISRVVQKDNSFEKIIYFDNSLIKKYDKSSTKIGRRCLTTSGFSHYHKKIPSLKFQLRILDVYLIISLSIKSKTILIED